MKKVFAVLMAVALVFAMSIPAFAAGTGTIEVKNTVTGATYEAYKMLDFVPSGEKNGVYTVAAGWEGFFEKAEVQTYFKTTETNDGKLVVTAVPEPAVVDQKLAKLAIEYAETTDGIAVIEKTADGETVVFSGLDLGYYVIDTTVGSFSNLVNANTTEEVKDKNEKPDIDKFVEEDKDGSWGYVNDATIGQVVNYKSTINVGVGATGYKMHDTMEAGLTFDPASVVVEGATAGEDYTLVTNCDDGCTFEIIFKDSFINDEVGAGKKFDVTYSATLNENAKIVDEGNINTVKLAYGEGSKLETKPHSTATYTWKLDFLKFANTEANPELPLAGAIFSFSTEGKTLKFTDVTVEGGVPTYKVDPNGTITQIETKETGKFEIIGIDEGVYTIKEEKAPEGYNELANDINVTITSKHTDADLTATYTVEDYNGTVKIENKTGDLLPETGGIGTTIFTIVGITLMVVAAVFLISKKRMSSAA